MSRSDAGEPPGHGVLDRTDFETSKAAEDAVDRATQDGGRPGVPRDRPERDHGSRRLARNDRDDGRPRAVILGGGVAGLYAGRVLAREGCHVTLFEKEPVVGGLAAGRERNGNYFDLGVHHLHAFDQEIFEDIRGLMGDRLIPVKKVAKIRYGLGYQRYPLEFGDMLRGIPPMTLLKSCLGLAAEMARSRIRPRQVHNAEDALIELYGRPLYEHFFQRFTYEYWGIPPTELSATFVRRKMPRLSAVDVIKKALSRFGLDDSGAAVESALRDETLWYSETGAREMPMSLADAIRATGGSVHTEAPVAAVQIEDGRVTEVEADGPDGRIRVPCDLCVSTIPLAALVSALRPPAGQDVREAVDQLEYKPIAVFGLRVARTTVLDALYVYYRDRIFHRVAEPKRSGLKVDPPDHTIILAEMTCDVGDARWRGEPEVVDQVISDLAAEGLLEPADVVEQHLFTTAHGYPVFRLGFEPHLETVETHLEGITNLRSTGRQGGFCYPNMHGAMRMGSDAGLALLTEHRASMGSNHA